ncbi:ATP/maltotriose-dependent transcriptional regulator MalT [Micromonospora kangleipakensis]|uniref:ATP/maltotriose-dependent transcriptional regulator MalT n=1 Tax=Micromonospora kangleipakensis TaxID=1077942 RepID=A0A4Q8BF63_9ACTN|nr:AAA family ATPase [Micromonospora kangleipakensis]RZU76031.1 ATP/maltotriose-dependent transcriptional regulator MalT [Micromonospora kangleipakensis]
MSGVDRLAEALGNGPAAAVVRALKLVNQRIQIDVSEWKAQGYTGARLAAVEISLDRAEHPRPRRCIAKVCPPGVGRPESEHHQEALERSWNADFAERHLVQLAFGPVECPDGEIVIGQQIAGGSLSLMQTLAKLTGTDRVDACRTVRAALLEDWTGRDYSTPRLALPSMLQSELRGGLLPDWLLAPTIGWIETAEDGVLPNPLALTSAAGPSTKGPLACLAGRTHGDLHVDNILVPTIDGIPRPAAFRLIDLATFDNAAPITRDPATLLVSILATEARTMGAAQQNALLEYVLRPRPTVGRQLPADLTDVVDTLRDPGDAPFIHAGYQEMWAEQLPVSLLASALLHTTYRSIGPPGRWWCLRLAARLAHTMVTQQPEGAPQRLTPAVFEDGKPLVVTPADRIPSPQQRLPGDASPASTGEFLNQKRPQAALRAAILGPGPNVIVVHGPAGVGKSALVRKVHRELPQTRPQTYRHNAAAAPQLDLKTLIDDIEAGVVPAGRLRRGESSLARLASAVETLDQRVAIIIDQAERLLRDGRPEVRDTDLDEALEFLSTTPHDSVKVILVTRVEPASADGNTWPDTARRINIEGLESKEFSTYLARLDPGGRLGLAILEAPTLTMLCGKLQGNPRHADMLHAVVAWSDSEFEADTLAARISALPARQVPQFLADELIDNLPNASRRALVALAAYGTPVDAAAVATLLRTELSERRVRAALGRLVNRHVVDQTPDGRYCIPAANLRRMLEAPADSRLDGATTWQDLLHDAAEELSRRRKRNADVHDVDDLQPHFAELDILLRAELYGAAYELMEFIDEVLQRWDCELLLLDRREEIKELLDDPFDKMSNYNALGHLYAIRGRFDAANNAFAKALDYETSLEDLPSRRKILTNMAAMHWEHNETERAADLYGEALSMAEQHTDTEQHTDIEDRMGALEGLADCHRRWGEYAAAMQLARMALLSAQHASASRAVNIALKLGRWHAELGEMGNAARLVGVAELEAAEHADPALRTACLDGRADLLLHPDRCREALDTAAMALAAARRQHSPVIQLQAQTTLCVAHLRLGELDEAGDAIERADRYRRAGRSLVVLALRALVAALRGHTAEANRRFEQLRREAQERRRRDPRDVGARQFEGYALSWRGLTDDRALQDATAAFRSARDQTAPAAPGIANRLAELVGHLDECGRRPGRLQPVINAIIHDQAGRP